MRPLTIEERTLLVRFASELSETTRGQLLEDIAHALADAQTPDGSRIKFEIAGYERPPYRGQHSFGVDGRMVDADGTELSVCLYADEDGRLLELEIFRWDFQKVIRPQWQTLVILNG